MIKSIGFASAWILPVALANLLPSGWLAGVSDTSPPPAPLKALLITGGGSADYKTLAPLLTNALGERASVSFDVDFTMDRLTNKNFADGYDVVIYDLCFDDADATEVTNALSAIRNGKPAVMIDCAIQAFAKVKSVAGEWQNAVGVKSPEPDKLEAFETAKMDTNSPILNGWPENWKTDGDELLEVGDLLPASRALLGAQSQTDGRARVVCWTRFYGKGRVFATTLGRAAATARDPAYLGLLTRGLLWSCDKLEPDGHATSGYGKQYDVEK